MNRTAICIGNFDGLHLGHKKLIDTFFTKAKERKLKPILITFRPHPVLFFYPDKHYLICDYQKKTKLLSDLYPEVEINITEFNKELQGMKAHEYVDEILKPKNPSLVCVGHDLTIGRDKVLARDIIPLRISSCDVLEIEPVKFNNEIISSSLIRSFLQKGDVRSASVLLDRSFSIIGEVGTGRRLGRELGFPTINIEFAKNIVLPFFGVYAVKVKVLNEEYFGVMNLGLNPTVSTSNRVKVEVHILDFNQDVYGEKVEVFFMDFIRPEIMFKDINQLKAQIRKDVLTVREKLNA